MKILNPLVGLILGALFLGGALGRADSNLVLVRSSQAVSSGKIVYHQFYKKDGQIYKARNHLSLAPGVEQGSLQVLSLNSSSFGHQSDLNQLVGDTLEKIELENGISLVKSQLNLIRKELRNIPAVLKVLTETYPLRKIQEGCIPPHCYPGPHALAQFLPGKPLDPKQAYPLNCADPQARCELEAYSQIDDGYLAGIEFIPKAGALTQKIDRELAPYPFFMCLDAELCEVMPASDQSDLTDPISRRIQTARVIQEGLNGFRFESIESLDAALISDLMTGQIEGIQLIYVLPVAEYVWGGSVRETESELSRFAKNLTSKKITPKNIFRSSFELGQGLSRLGLESSESIDFITDQIDQGDEGLNVEALRSEKLTFLSEELLHVSRRDKSVGWDIRNHYLVKIKTPIR